MTFLDDAAADVIQPTEIGHHVDEVWRDVVGGELEQRYNFIDYHFDAGGAYMTGRAYTDTMDEVVVEGPYASRDSEERIEAQAFEAAVRGWFARRFATVKRR